MAFSIETATTRDLLSRFFPEHEDALHSVIHAVYERGKMKLTLSCTCGSLLVIKEIDAKKHEFNFVDVVDRLRKLGKFDAVKPMEKG